MTQRKPKLKAAVQKRRAARKQRLSETSAEMKRKARERVAKWRAAKKERVRESVEKVKEKRKPTMATNEKEKEPKKETKEDKKEDVLPMPEPTKVFKGDGTTRDFTGTDQEKKSK